MAVELKAKRLRKIIAVNMTKSWQTSPKCDFLMKADMGPLMALRLRLNEEHGAKISYLVLVMKAAAIALKEFPFVNSSYDFENHVHLLHEDVNIGVAISVEGGLIVANVKHTDQMELLMLSRETERLILGAKSGALTLDDITGGTFTINNMGAYPRLIQHTAIINPPELAILSMYRITDEPVVKNGMVMIQKTMNLALSADHRVIDGQMACEFLTRIVELLENPESLIE